MPDVRFIRSANSVDDKGNLATNVNSVLEALREHFLALLNSSIDSAFEEEKPRPMSRNNVNVHHLDQV